MPDPVARDDSKVPAWETPGSMTMEDTKAKEDKMEHLLAVTGTVHRLTQCHMFDRILRHAKSHTNASLESNGAHVMDCESSMLQCAAPVQSCVHNFLGFASIVGAGAAAVDSALQFPGDTVTHIGSKLTACSVAFFGGHTFLGSQKGSNPLSRFEFKWGDLVLTKHNLVERGKLK